MLVISPLTVGIKMWYSLEFFLRTNHVKQLWWSHTCSPRRDWWCTCRIMTAELILGLSSQITSTALNQLWCSTRAGCRCHLLAAQRKSGLLTSPHWKTRVPWTPLSFGARTQKDVCVNVWKCYSLPDGHLALLHDLRFAVAMFCNYCGVSQCSSSYMNLFWAFLWRQPPAKCSS